MIPSEPAYIDWATPEFSSNDFILAGGQVTPVTLTNTADVATGSFSITKELAGDVNTVPQDLLFTGSYLVTLPGGDTRDGAFEVLAGET